MFLSVLSHFLVGVLGGPYDRQCYGRSALRFHALSQNAWPARATGYPQGQPTSPGRSPAGDPRGADWAQNTSLINTTRKLWIPDATQTFTYDHFSHLILTHLLHTNRVCCRENHTHFQRQSRHYSPFLRTMNEGKKRTSCWGLRSVPPGIGSEIRWLMPLRGTSVISSLLRVKYTRSVLLHAFQFHRV